MRVVVVLAVALAAVVVAQPALGAQSKRQAERNLLSATRVLARWNVGLIDPRTRLLRRNTTAVCRGVGSRRPHGYASFVCVLTHSRTVVRVRYVALRRNGFEVHHLRS